MHRFPKEDQLCSIWVEKIQNVKLEQKSLEDIRKSYRVCDVHFEASTKIIDGRGRKGSNLKYGSIPSQNMPPVHGEVLATSNTCLQEMTADDYNLPGPSSVKDTYKYGSEDFFDAPKATSPIAPVCEVPASIHTPKSRRDLRRRVNLMKTIETRFVAELSPKAMKLHKIASGFKKTAKRLDVELSSVKKRLKFAMAYSESPEFLRAQVNDTSYHFITSQLKMQKVSPKGLLIFY